MGAARLAARRRKSRRHSVVAAPDSGGLVKPQWRRLVIENRQQEQEESAARAGLTATEYQRRAAVHLRSLLAEAEIATRLFPSTLDRVLTDGRFKSAGELGATALPETYRAELERRAYRLPATIYAYAATEDEPVCRTRGEPISGIEAYGPLKCVLSPDVRHRATVTLGDAGFGLWGEAVAPAPIDEPDAYCVLAHLDPFIDWDSVNPAPVNAQDCYCEVQIHGGLSVADIARVDVMGPVEGIGPLLERLDALGIPHRLLQQDAADAFTEQEMRRTMFENLVAVLVADGRGEPAGVLTLLLAVELDPSAWKLDHLPLEPAGQLVNAVLDYSPSAGSVLHGLEHWRQVAETGLTLAGQTEGVDPLIVLLFALFHDSMRVNDDEDAGHGGRGAELARSLNEGLIGLDADRLRLLEEACARHTDGVTTSDPTIGVSWDADRLDLPRVGIIPSAELLSTAAARSSLEPEAAESISKEAT